MTSIPCFSGGVVGGFFGLSVLGVVCCFVWEEVGPPAAKTETRRCVTKMKRNAVPKPTSPQTEKYIQAVGCTSV